MKPSKKSDRAVWRKRIEYLVSCTKLNHEDSEYMHVSDLIELIDDVPEWDLSAKDRKKYLEELGVKE